jgi:hypothetical protein
MKKLYISIFALSLSTNAFSQIDAHVLTVQEGEIGKKKYRIKF